MAVLLSLSRVKLLVGHYHADEGSILFEYQIPAEEASGPRFREGDHTTRMGDVPINSTGFAQRFRPLEGDHPPPTPTQQSAVPPGFPNAGLLSQSQRSSHGGGGGMSGGLDWPRKRRRLPGPLAFFQQGGSGIEG